MAFVSCQVVGKGNLYVQLSFRTYVSYSGTLCMHRQVKEVVVHAADLFSQLPLMHT